MENTGTSVASSAVAGPSLPSCGAVPATGAVLSVELSFVPLFNLALQQNALPVINELRVRNDSGRDLRGLSCSFSAAPEFIIAKTISVELLKAGEELPLRKLDIELNYQLLTALSDTQKGSLRLAISDGEVVIWQRDYAVEAFAADQWLGIQVLPELLCSFVTPNLEVINQLLNVVATELERATGSAAIQGYQADKTRVYEICTAIYRAIHSWGIRYTMPPASTGTPGQRVRFADAIYKHRLGTCLDLSLLFASVMEQCGLHPVIMLTTSHAYIGCHLFDRYFSDIPMDDLQAIRKMVELDEFLVLETTLVTGDASFSRAEAVARSEHLLAEEDFVYALDVIRARLSGIRALPLARSTGGIELLPEKREVKDLVEEQKRSLRADLDLNALAGAGNSKAGRIVHWQHRLLDLSLRNRLLNVRDTKHFISLACPDPTVLEDVLANDEPLSLNSLVGLLSEKDRHDLSMQRAFEMNKDVRELLNRELGQRRLWTLLTPDELRLRMTKLYRQSRIDLEEGGVNTLFLAVGFLEWKQSERDSRSFLAPILLIPVQLQRKSMTEGIRLSRVDEDTSVNVTLLELLRRDYHLTVPGLEPLPCDEHGVDVAMVMQIFRQTIKDMKGWELREEAHIGLFSFGKFLMWNDLAVRAEALTVNPLVRHLVAGGGLYDDGIEVFPLSEVGRYIDLPNLYCPLSADSSQLAAVLYSAVGKSFVLHGPPGTGKSQTITNIIAHNMSLGRRVLFVSEKKAALEVVHKRLSGIGLGPFCLELHSNKSGKTEVLEQFAEALAVPETAVPDEWVSTTASLQALRRELNEYVQALHRVYPNGFSAYDCFTKALQDSRELPELSMGTDFLAQSREDYEACARAVVALGTSWAGVEPGTVPALAWLDSVAWSPVCERDLLAGARGLDERCRAVLEQALVQTRALGLPEDDNIRHMYDVACLSALLRESVDIPAPLLVDDVVGAAEFLASFSGTARRYRELRESLGSYQQDMLVELDFAGITARIQVIAQTSPILRFFKSRAILKELAGIKKVGGGKLTMAELSALLPRAQAYAVSRRDYEASAPRAAALLGARWCGGEPDWDGVKTLLDCTRGIYDALCKVCARQPDRVAGCLEVLAALLPQASVHFVRDGEPHRQINDFLAAWNAFEEQLQAFGRYASGLVKEERVSVIRGCLRQLFEHAAELRGVLIYRQAREACRGRQLEDMARVLEDGAVSPETLADCFESAYQRKMLDQILGQTPVLSAFSGLTHEERIRRFCDLDDRYTALSRQIIFARLAASLPRRRSGPCPEGTELGILKRECEKRSRQKPVRVLLEQIPTLAPVLKPCFLMSPLSVAQYLPPDTAAFDVIVFDEASQIPVWDAVGVIARGRQLIVVGDPKQMPPTSFFQRGDSDAPEAVLDNAEDTASILDECLAAGVYSTYLNWHYRSRHEALISFSNHYYYGDKLFTFPAARDADHLGVSYRFIADGIYDRRVSRSNRLEAEAIVDFVFEQLRKAGGKPQSIGIVTFNLAQKDLIEDLLEQRRSSHPEFESFFSDQQEEPLFVKNLENVQGDERDMILFSVCYSHDSNGGFAMNFGPLNLQGGERRLNVAITRAKERIVVFASIHASDIDLSRTNAVGAAHLKYFLDYAEKGHRLQPWDSGQVAKGGLLTTVAEFLTRQGYTVEREVGSSGYRIDLALRNPDNPAEFLMGIECDGNAYAAQRTTRDRDHLRGTVLRSLGWHIHRAWSVDWAFDRRRAEEKLLSVVHERQRRAQEDHAQSLMIASSYSQPAAMPVAAAIVPDAPVTPAAPGAPVFANRRRYSAWAGVAVEAQDAFYDPRRRPLIMRQMREVIEHESPIYERCVKKRIVKAWGFNRAGDTIQAILNDCLPNDLVCSETDGERVYWAAGQDPGNYRFYRVPDDDSGKRAIDEIPPEELANAMVEVLTDFTSCEVDTLFRETVKIFGLVAVTTKARQYLQRALHILQASGRI